MADNAIRMIGVGKRYSMHNTSTSSVLAATGLVRRFIKNLYHRGPSVALHGGQMSGQFWALRDVNFDIKQGDVVGIVGRNGAGKSTMLKILSRITPPTTGRVEIRGRLGSLLEIGTGFNPELTGRQNVYLSAAILGMNASEVKADFDAIVDFSGVENFLDMPVKHYSSGMYMRLAFAVAAHLRHEILLIDEVLAVGDAAFQQKCVGRISEEASSGRTVVFVSHNLAAVLSLCTKAILLEEGVITKIGTPDDVVGTYLGRLNELKCESEWSEPKIAPGNSLFRVKAIRARGSDGLVRARYGNSEDWFVEVEYWNLISGSAMGVTLAIYNATGMCVFGSISNLEECWHGKPRPAGLFLSRVKIPGDLMKEGIYKIVILLWGQGYTDQFRIDEAAEVEVYDSGQLRGDYFGGWEGVVHPRLAWTCEHLQGGI